jgi:diguanylate cyclase (GGDEF)-like protein
VLFAVLTIHPQAQPGHIRTITTAHEAHELPLAEARQSIPVHLRVVITYYDPYIDSRHGAIFAHDATGSIFISVPKRPILPIKAGSLVDVVAVTGTGDYAPIVHNAEIRVVGQSHVPAEAPRVTLEQLRSSVVDGQWVEIVGQVHAVRVLGEDVVFDLATADGHLSATTLVEPGADYDHLVDSRVRIHGNEAPVFNLNRQLVGAHVYFPSLAELKVLQTGPSDPFATPPVPIPDLLMYKPGVGLPSRVHVRGRVTLQWPGRRLCIQQASGGLCMQTAQTTPVKEGDVVDVIGFPATNDYKPTLENSTYRLAAEPWQRPFARTITAEEAFAGDHDAELVQIEGDLIGLDHASGDPALMLRSGNSMFPAILPKGTDGAKPPQWREGSRLRVTGICSAQVDDLGTSNGEGALRLKSAQILLRSLDDVVVLKEPSWWTTSRSLKVLELVAVMALAAIFWVMVLRRRVEQQTEVIRKSEERLRHLSQHDALTGLPNRNLLDDRMNMALAHAARFKGILAVLMVDLDRFKEVNDSLGHQAGDEVLRQVAQRLGASVRKTDTVARIGGDEFIVLLANLRTAKEAEVLAGNIIAAASAPIHSPTLTATIAVSVGVATFPDCGTDAETLLNHADQAMYRAKAQGQNGFMMYSAEMANSTPSHPSAISS